MPLESVRRIEIVAALSLATDLAIGQPAEFALRSCALSVALAQAAHLDADTVRQVYYQSLLRYIGCNADTEAQAALFGDETLLRRGIALIDQGRPRDVLAVVLRALRRANGPEGLKMVAAPLRAAIPDAWVTVDDQIAEGDRAVTRWTAGGTQTGELMGMPASGRTARVTGANIARFVDGKIVESWFNFDMLSLLQQLGAIPEPAGR